jgi:hypothetical protein
MLHQVNLCSLKYLSVGCIFLVLAGSATSGDALPSGVMEGHLEILSPKPVELGHGNAPTVTSETYAEYPLIIVSPLGFVPLRAR